ncbi:putative E3 ubiquitin protein ligase KCMF1 [Trypanosoma vivax]|uniref:ZZ-type domain-containing protein n=1 Tax=Trypanosoma vivax (strain Y486) TaxID=1055687 RepID=G0TR19_TRYVY|nr:hypothetical protein TRVL_01230 [Trypanosoma vivax]KAH8611924.1 putative E3 ubiquitin protein ligase KCMF1 [Trypanosoma vivax]CCC46383.1 conserved hypothetical protein [Trypanosoma vivax Y486]
MNEDECIISNPVSWSMMLKYERDDTIAQLCRQFSFFSVDKLKLVEREEFVCSSNLDFESTDLLLIRGSVGITRSEAFLRLLRLARLTIVQDLASNVIVAPQVGDILPHMMLYPLWETNQTKSFRRWNILYWATKCGIVRKFKRRNDMTKQHVEHLINKKQDNGQQATGSDGDICGLKEEVLYNAYREVIEMEQEDQNETLDIYHTACSEERVDLSLISASVTTVVVVWASWDDKSVCWIREKLFNPNNVDTTSCSMGQVSCAFEADGDPWLKVVNEFIAIRSKPPVRQKNGNILSAKCAQIVLISVDRDKDSAVSVLSELMVKTRGWKSPVVSLLPLWSGPEGLQSEMATAINVTELPFFVAIQNCNPQTTKQGSGRYPRICYITSNLQNSTAPQQTSNRNALAEFHKLDTELVDWHLIDREERSALASSIAHHITTSGAPLKLNARVDRAYQMIRVPQSMAGKLLKPFVTSSMILSGIISTTDLLKMGKDLRALCRIKNCMIDLRVMKPSSPVTIELNPVTPTKYIYGHVRSVTCGECHREIMIDEEFHFRCIHCEQVDGVVCRRCFSEGFHPQHHILLRVNLNAPTTIELLWGPSNVVPLVLFRGVLLNNTSETHVGVYCNLCSKIIRGIRWKCSVCYQFDVCDQCDENKIRPHLVNRRISTMSRMAPSLRRGVHSAKVSVSHPKEHMFLCIRHGCGSDGDACLRPVMDTEILKSILNGEVCH